MKINDIFYTYIYLDPRKKGPFTYGEYTFDYEPFYVGKGKYGRYKDHLLEIQNKFLDDNNLSIKQKFLIELIHFEKYEPIIVKIKENMIEQESFNLEIDLITLIGRKNLHTGPLLNLTSGGQGVSGKIFTTKDRQAISKRMKQLYIDNPTLKYILSKRSRERYKDPNERLKNSIASKGKVNIGNKNGNYKSEIHIKKICKECNKQLPESNQTFFCKSCSVKGNRNPMYTGKMYEKYFCEKCGIQLKGKSKTKRCRSCSQLGKYHPLYNKPQNINHKRNVILKWREKHKQKYDKLCVSIMGFDITLNDDPFMKDVGLTIFCAKCNAKCKNCHNPESWDEKNGKQTSVKEIKLKINNVKELVKHIVFCGGEFLLYPKQLSELLIWCKLQGLRTILYTGKLYKCLSPTHKMFSDIVIDGKYIDNLKTGKFPASENQNIYVNENKLSRQEIDTLQINKNLEVNT